MSHPPAWEAARQQHPMGQLVVILQGSPIWTLGLAPSLTVDGYRVASRYGPNHLIVPAGVHRIEVQTQWPRRHGNAWIDVQVAPQQSVQVFYASPVSQWIDEGSIGFTRQSPKGVAPLVIGLAVLVLLALWKMLF